MIAVEFIQTVNEECKIVLFGVVLDEPSDSASKICNTLIVLLKLPKNVLATQQKTAVKLFREHFWYQF